MPQPCSEEDDTDSDSATTGAGVSGDGGLEHAQRRRRGGKQQRGPPRILLNWMVEWRDIGLGRFAWEAALGFVRLQFSR